MQNPFGQMLIRQLGGGDLISIWGADVKGDFYPGNAGLSIADNVFRTLNTADSENNITVLKNQIAGQPDLFNLSKTNMPRIEVADLNGWDSFNLDAASTGFISNNTVTGTGLHNAVIAVFRGVGNLTANNRLFSTTTDALQDWNNTTAFALPTAASATSLQQFYNSSGRATDSGSYVDSWITTTSILNATGSVIRRNGVQTGTATFTNATTYNRFLVGYVTASSVQNAIFRCARLLYISSANPLDISKIIATENILRGQFAHY